MSKDVSVQIELLLDEYSEEVQKLAEKNARAVAKEAVEKLKATSPKRKKNGGEYAGGWRVKKEDGKVIVHNAKKPGLTHLLEKGHVVRNGKGTFGRAPAHVHIAPVEEWANQEYQDRMERDLQ